MLVIIREGMCAENLKTASLIYFKEPRREKNNEKVTISEMLVTASPPSDESTKVPKHDYGHVRSSRHLTDGTNGLAKFDLASRCSRSPQSCSSRTLLQQLHCPPIKHRIDFKIANITFRTLYSSQTGLPTSILACLSFHSFSQTLQH